MVLTEMALKFFCYLNKAELKQCLLVDKTWQLLAREKLRQIDFFGDSGKEKPFPNYMIQSSSLVFPGLKGPTFGDLVNMIKTHKEQNPTNAIVSEENVNSTPTKSHWVLISPSVIPGQRFFGESDPVIPSNHTYRLPTVVEAVTHIMAQHVSNAKQLSMPPVNINEQERETETDNQMDKID